MSARQVSVMIALKRMALQSAACLLLGFVGSGTDVLAASRADGSAGSSRDDALVASTFSCSANPETDRREPATFEVRLGEAPALLRMPSHVTMPPIVLWHGFGPPASEQALLEALPLDDVPAIKVYLGLPLFGKRAPPGGMDEIARRQSSDYGALLFEPAVMGAARELAIVRDELQRRGCLRTGQEIGLLGFSAGGAAVLFALAERTVPVRTAITLNAPIGLASSIEALERVTKQAYVWTPHTRGLATMTDSIRRAPDIAAGDPPPALMLWHGSADRIIATRNAALLHETLAPLYAATGHPERLKLTLAPEGAHDITSPASLRELRVAVGDWFNAHR